MASYAACSCFLMASNGSSLIFEAVSRSVFAFCAATNESCAVAFCTLSFPFPCRMVSTLRLPSKNASFSSEVPDCPAGGPWYIQSTRAALFFPPAASCNCCNSCSWRSSSLSFLIWSIFLRSSSARFSSSHTFFWLVINDGCHDFLRLRSPPMSSLLYL